MDNFQIFNLYIPSTQDLDTDHELSLYQIIDYLKFVFKNLKNNQVNVSKRNLEANFEDIKKELLKIKGDDEYKPKDERLLINELIEKCDLSFYLNKVLILNSNKYYDEDFDLRDIKLEHEIKNLITIYSALITDSSSESEVLKKYSTFRKDILDVINKLVYSFFSSFQLSGNFDDIFEAFKNIFTGRKKLKLPDNIDIDSKEVFSYKLTPEDVDICRDYSEIDDLDIDVYTDDDFEDLNERIDLSDEDLIGTRYFSFEESIHGETFKRLKLDFANAFMQWYERELMRYSVPIPPPKEKYPQVGQDLIIKTMEGKFLILKIIFIYLNFRKFGTTLEKNFLRHFDQEILS